MTARTTSPSCVLSASVAALMWLAACAGAGEAPGQADAPRVDGVAKFAGDPRLGEEVSQVCPARTMSGFSQNTDDTVVIEMGKDSYLVEMRRGCYALRGAMGIAPTSISTCLRSGDQILVTDAVMPTGSSQPMGSGRCSINRIFHWTPIKPVTKPKDAQD